MSSIDLFKFPDLKQFLKLSEKSNKHVEMYIKSGGKPLELIETIKANEEGNLEIISGLFKALQIVVYDVIKPKDENLGPTTQALQYLINRNKTSLNKMLNSTNTKDKILILKLLCISISLDGNLAQEILKSLELFTSSDINENSLKDTDKNVVYEESLRLSFVHFFLAFLIDENLQTRKRILRKPNLVELLMQNLQNDSFEIIKLIFTSLTKNVLICSAFSKPEKLKLFSDNVIKSILKLYEWEGPKKSLLSDSTKETKENVAAIAHEFLLLLLTSKKHGIVFKALTEKRQNQRQSQVISYLKNCWNFELQSELVIEIVRSCPDLMQNVLNKLMFTLKPVVKTGWFLAMNFTKQLLCALEPSDMIQHIKGLEPKKISSNIIKFSISQFLLQNLEANALISISNVAVRENTVHLLLICLDQCCKYLEEIKKLKHFKHFQIHRIKFDIINHIFTFFPNIDLILNSLYRSVNLCKNSLDPEVQESLKNQLKYTLDLLLLVIKHFPSVIEKVPSIIDYLEVLRPIYEYNKNIQDLENSKESLEIEMKVAKIILHLEPSILSAESLRFEKVFEMLIQIYCFSNDECQKCEAKTLLTVTLVNLEVFPTEIEIDLWIEAFKAINRTEVQMVSSIFVKTLRDVKGTIFEIAEGSMNVAEMEDFLGIPRKIDGESEVVAQEPTVSLSCVYQQLFQSNGMKKLTKISRYIEVVSVFLYHFAGPKKFKVGEKFEEFQLQIVNYFNKQSKGKLIKLSKYFETDCYNLIDKILEGSPATSDSLESVKSVEHLIILMIQLFFCLKISSLEKQELINDWIKICFQKMIELELKNPSVRSDVLEDLDISDVTAKIHKIKDLNPTNCSDKIVSHILMDRDLLEEFEFSATNKTIGLLKIFKGHSVFQSSTQFYREMLVNQLKSVEVTEETIELLEVSGLDEGNCQNILKEVSAEPRNLLLISFLLERLTLLKKDPFDPEFISKIEKTYLKCLKGNSNKYLQRFEVSFYDYLRTFCHNVADVSGKIFEICFDDPENSELKIKLSTKTFIRLICFLFERNRRFDVIFLENYKEIYKNRKELFYPLLNVAFAKQLFNEQSNDLKTVYLEFKSGITKAIEKSHKAAQIYRENLLCNLKLIEYCMPNNECQDLTLKKYKFEQTEIFQLKMLFKIYEKSVKNSESPNFSLNFVNNWLQMFNLMVSKKSELDLGYLNVLEDFCGSKIDESLLFDEINEKNWENFYRNCLKYGLKDHPQMLITLGKFINILIPDDSANEEIPQLFDMILTHSNFFNVSFSFKNLDAKRNLYFLLNILVQKNHSVASEKHIPIYLASYHATMAKTDRLILNLIRFYELNCGIDLNDFKPMLFGAIALNHYSDEDKEFFAGKKNIDNIVTTIGTLLNSLEKVMLESTLNNFPIMRELKTMTAKEIDESLSFQENNDDLGDIYDPAFFLPLFDMIFSTSTWDFSVISLKNNLLSLVWPALSCNSESMRLLAAHVLLKFREISDNKK
jgi:nucleolar pre-ribosomal-associated protein 1